MTQAKGSDNVLQSLGSRSCSERDNWNVRVFFPNIKKCTILKSPLVRYRSSKKNKATYSRRAKVTSPSIDKMRFINYKSRQLLCCMEAFQGCLHVLIEV